MENQEDITGHVKEFFTSLCTKEKWEWPLLNNLAFNRIGKDYVQWLEREFEEEVVRQAVFVLGGDKAWVTMVFLWSSSSVFGTR